MPTKSYTYDFDGIAPEIIVNGKNGYLINSTKEAKKRIRQILKNNKLREEMSYEAHKSTKKFRADILARKLVSLYENITGKKVNTPIKIV